MPTVSEITGREAPSFKAPVPVQRLAMLPSDLTINSDTLIGIEVEVEQVHVATAPNAIWQVIEDHSLRNGGREFVSHPMPARWAGWALQHLLNECMDQGQCAFTMRTSIHIHVNMLDATSEQVRSMVLLYLLFEKELYRFVGRARWKNVFCVPVLDTDKHLRLLTTPWHKLQWEKYMGLNLCRLSDYGTMEFRHMAGTFDVEKIVRWIKILLSLKIYAMSIPSKRLLEIFAHLKADDVEPLGREIFGDMWSYLEFSDHKELQEIIPKIKDVFGAVDKTEHVLSDQYYTDEGNAAYAKLIKEIM